MKSAVVGTGYVVIAWRQRPLRELAPFNNSSGSYESDFDDDLFNSIEIKNLNKYIIRR